MLEGEETEMVFIDHPHSEISVNGEKCETDTEFRAHYGVQITDHSFRLQDRSQIGGGAKFHLYAPERDCSLAGFFFI